MSTKILVVDDSAVIRGLLVKALSQEPGFELSTAHHGGAALEQIEREVPDIVILDVEMPEVDGIEALRRIRALHPKLPVIMFSSLTERGAAVTMDALTLGANDYLTKPNAAGGSIVESMDQVREELTKRIRTFCPDGSGAAPTPTPVPASAPARTVHAPDRSVAAPALAPGRARGRIDVVVIATSTGGPNALMEVVPELPAGLPVPIVLVQHMPPVFTATLSRSLDAKSGLHVAEGVDGRSIQAGEVWVAPGGFHMTVKRDGAAVVLGTNEDPPEHSCRPAADVLMRSVVQVYGGSTLGVVLTGMGQDGRLGAEAIRHAGGQVIVQDEATSVVWGMPGAVARDGLADKVLPLSGIAQEIVRRVEKHAPQPWGAGSKVVSAR